MKEEGMEELVSRTAQTGLLDTQALSPGSHIVASKEQLSCDLVGEAVILNLRTGVYYGLDSVGARIWSLVQKPIRVSDLIDILLSEYDVDPDRCKRDLLDLLTELKATELIGTWDGEVDHIPPPLC
jgi:hypothetical protein